MSPVTALLVFLLFALCASLLLVGLSRRRVHQLTNDLAVARDRIDALADRLRKAEDRDRKHLAELDKAIRALRWYGIRGNWTGDGGRDGRFAWTGGDLPWMRARKGMGRHWTTEPTGTPTEVDNG